MTRREYIQYIDAVLDHFPDPATWMQVEANAYECWRQELTVDEAVAWIAGDS